MNDPRQAKAGHGSAPLPHPVRRVALTVALLSNLLVAPPAMAEERRNWFDDPFTQATNGMPACPVPEGPLLTEAEMRREGHHRIERGTTCWLAKQCEQPNAYAHDARINAAVVQQLAGDDRWRNTSLWVITQRRFVFLQGCVRSAAQKKALIDAVRSFPDVEYVGDELLVGTRGKPPYRSAAAGDAGRR
jgi:hypothetical protein